MSAPLGRGQLVILRTLARRPDGEMPLSTTEITAELWRHGSRMGITDSATRSSLVRLEARGYVERLGTASNGANCWCISPAGRDALAEVTR